MTKKYMFAVEELDEDGNVVSTKVHTFTTEHEAWSGFEGPMYNFFQFLRGEGFGFGKDAEIGVMRKSFLNPDEEEFAAAIVW